MMLTVGQRLNAIRWSKSLKERFEEKVMPEPNTGCHIWNSSLDDAGYGRFNVNNRASLAHRVAYEIYVSAVPEGKHVLHTCDNRYCVNPTHLFLGTHVDNMTDMIKKGRGRKKSILNPSQIIIIKEAHSAGYSQASIARYFGVHHNTINGIIRGANWKHV